MSATGLGLLFLGGIEIVIDGEKVVLIDRLTYRASIDDGVMSTNPPVEARTGLVAAG